jgi:hypothetical protein
MSLVENIAPRHASTTASLDEVRTLRQSGHNTEEIAARLGMDKSYRHSGEHRRFRLVRRVFTA